MDFLTSNLKHLHRSNGSGEKEKGYEGEMGFQVSRPAPPSPVNALSTESPLRTASPKSTISVPSPKVSPRLSTRSSSTRDSISSIYIPIPNTDQLPTSPAALEGLLNHHTSQLQKLADRVEAVNEWIDLDKIVLARIIADDAAGTEKAAVEEGAAAAPDGDVVGKDQILIHGSHAGAKLSRSNGHSSDGLVEVATCRVREATERIKGMRRWRKELEWSVYWQREEYWRVEKAMGRKRSESVGRSEEEGVGKWVGAR